MNAHETITGQAFVNGSVAMHMRNGTSEWRFDTEDENGGEWVLMLTTPTDMGGADDFAKAIRSALAWNDEHDNPANLRPVVITSIYNEVSDSLWVGFENHRIPLSICRWE